MFSPLRYGFVAIDSTSSANSSGRPIRFGNWMSASAASHVLVGAHHDRRAHRARCDGADADTDRREVASHRRVIPRIAALAAPYASCPVWPSMPGDRRGVDDDAALAVLVGLVRRHGGRGRRVTLNVPNAFISMVWVNAPLSWGVPSRRPFVRRPRRRRRRSRRSTARRATGQVDGGGDVVVVVGVADAAPAASPSSSPGRRCGRHRGRTPRRHPEVRRGASPSRLRDRRHRR